MNNIKYLPEDIKRHIIPFTYSLQPKELMEDVSSYNITKKKIFSIYSGFWFDDNDEKSDKCWLINDIFAFANDYNPTIFGYVDSFYSIFLRNIMLRYEKDKINKFIVNLEKQSLEKQINIFWGLFTPEEREDFIEIANMKIRIIN